MSQRRGRPRKLTPADLAKAIDLIAAGAEVAEAAREVGCSTRTLHRYAERDGAFAERLRQAYRDRAERLRVASRESGEPAATAWAARSLLDELAKQWGLSPTAKCQKDIKAGRAA